MRRGIEDRRHLAHSPPLDNPERSRSESRARRNRHTAGIFAEFGVTPPEASLLHVACYGIDAPPDDVHGPVDEPTWGGIDRWASLDVYSIGGKSTRAQCRAALTACLNKGWLQVIDEPALAKIVDELRERRVLGPIYGLPPVGAVAFTDAGAALWQQIAEPRRGDSPRTPSSGSGIVRAKSTRYLPTRAKAVAEIESARNNPDVISVTGPFPTGPWRAQWWRRFPEGYRIEIEEHNSTEKLGIESESCYFASSPPEEDPQRLQYILDCHNVTFTEWILLQAMEDGPRSLHAVKRRGLRECLLGFGGTISNQMCILGPDGTISEEAVRNGLDACLRHGWLRALDQHVLDEIHHLLRNDPALLALPKTAELRPEGSCVLEDPDHPGHFVSSLASPESRWGEIEFSPTGAALYRMISAEWLGPDLEEGFLATKRYSWEEHHFCESEEGFRRNIQEHIANGLTIEATRIVPIGPWCIHWWDRYPSGYRLELEIGDRR
ncbi:hypothetical protein ACYOEI_10485 [Singulisphaera rosea]